jgi:hypothetical protein
MSAEMNDMRCSKTDPKMFQYAKGALIDMKKITGLCAGICLVFGSGAGAMVAQEAGMSGPPKVLMIEREFTKPGKGGAAHEKSESAFVNAVVAAKWPTHYFAANSMSGRPRALFFFGYPSFEAWEKDNKAMEKNATLAAAIERASVADGELLSDFDAGVFVYDPDLSLHDTGGVAHSRYFEISQYRVKPGHRSEFQELVKLYQKGYASISNANWATFESYYGADNGGLYIAISRMTSLAEDDASMGDGKKFSDAMGADGMKKVRELTAACLESQSTNLFSFDPKMSYPDPEWIKADPFWKPTAAAAPAAKKAPANP